MAVRLLLIAPLVAAIVGVHAKPTKSSGGAQPKNSKPAGGGHLKTRKKWNITATAHGFEGLKNAAPVNGSWADKVMDKNAPKPQATEKKPAATGAKKYFPDWDADKIAAKHAKELVDKEAAKSATAFHNTGSLKLKMGPGPAPALMMRAPAPAPAPVPAPLTYEQKVAKLKGDVMRKIGADSFDADLVIERPTKVPPGSGKKAAVPEFKDVGNDFGPYAKPVKPLKSDDISFQVNSLPDDARHKDRDTMLGDWHKEYGPHGPKGMHGTSPGGGIMTGNFQPLRTGGL